MIYNNKPIFSPTYNIIKSFCKKHFEELYVPADLIYIHFKNLGWKDEHGKVFESLEAMIWSLNDIVKNSGPGRKLSEYL